MKVLRELIHPDIRVACVGPGKPLASLGCSHFDKPSSTGHGPGPRCPPDLAEAGLGPQIACYGARLWREQINVNRRTFSGRTLLVVGDVR